MISNSVDLPAARELAINIGKYGTFVTLASNLMDAQADVVIILGVPKAYEGVGKLSNSHYQNHKSKKLISKEGSTVTVVSRNEGIDYVVIAGHTRVETAKAALEFPSPWMRLTALSSYTLNCSQVTLGPVVYSYQGGRF